jgi:hypothetical protein
MDTNAPEPENRFKTADGLEKTEVPDGFVIFKAETEKVHYLNPTAAIIFELSDGTKNLGEIAEFIREAYKLPEAPLHEILACTQNLVEQGLLYPCPK